MFEIKTKNIWNLQEWHQNMQNGKSREDLFTTTRHFPAQNDHIWLVVLLWRCFIRRPLLSGPKDGLTVALLPSIDENWWILIMLYVLKCCYIQIFSFSKCCTCWCTAILRSNNLLKDRNQDRKQDRSSYWRCSVKRDILKISQVLQRNSDVGVSF